MNHEINKKMETKGFEHPKKAIHMTLVSANGLSKGKYASAFQNIITGEQLF